MDNILKSSKKKKTTMKYIPKCIPTDDIQKYRISDDERKSNFILHQLIIMNYDVVSERDVIKVIEEHGIDKFDFDYPYGSFEAYKKHVLVGEFDVESHMATKEEHEQFVKWEKEGKITY